MQFLICCTYIRRPQKLPLLLLRMIIDIIITNSVNVITGRLLCTSNHIYKKLWMLSSQWHANIAKMNCFLLSRGCNGSSDDSYGIYAWIHWRNMKCHASPQPHRRKVKTRAVFCLSRVRNKSRMTKVDALQLLSWIELEICWKYQFPAKKRQNRLKILMEKPFQPSVTDVYSEIG